MKPTDADRDPAFDRLIARGLEGETDVTGNACPDADLLAAWFDRSLSASEAERIEAHASHCGPCQQILADLARSEPPVVRAAPEPAPARPWHWHWRWIVPIATATVVIVVVGNRTLRAPEPPATVTDRVAPEIGGRPSTWVELQRAEPERPKEQAPAAPTGRSVEEKNAMARADAPPPAGGSLRPATPDQPAERAQPTAAPAPPAQQAASLMAEARADRQGFAGENRLAAQLPGAANAPGASGGTAGTPAKPAAADKAEVVVGRAAESVATTAPAPPPAGVPLTGVAMKARSVAPPIPAVAASPTGRVAWRVGAGGSVERSTDGRETWQPQASGIATNLAAVSAVADTTCWAAGARGVVLRTTDGLTWERLAPPTGSDLVFVLASSEDAAIVRAADGSEYSTADGGRTWQRRR